jgi:hypothetical protein
VVVGDFDIGWSFLLSVPAKTNAVLTVDANAELALTITAKRLEAISPHSAEIENRNCRIERNQMPSCLAFDIGEFRYAIAVEQLFRPRIFERLNQYFYGITFRVIAQEVYA